jgi:hypothetical protein
VLPRPLISAPFLARPAIFALSARWDKLPAGLFFHFQGIFTVEGRREGEQEQRNRGSPVYG